MSYVMAGCFLIALGLSAGMGITYGLLLAQGYRMVAPTDFVPQGVTHTVTLPPAELKSLRRDHAEALIRAGKCEEAKAWMEPDEQERFGGCT